MGHLWVVRVFDGLYVWLLGGTCRRCGTRRGKGEKKPRRKSWFAVLAPSCYGDGGVKHQWERMGGGIGENEHDFHRVRFRDALAGPPTSWVPPGVIPSLHPALAGIVVVGIPHCRGGRSCHEPDGRNGRSYSSMVGHPCRWWSIALLMADSSCRWPTCVVDERALVVVALSVTPALGKLLVLRWH